jgi:hypothetical protein
MADDGSAGPAFFNRVRDWQDRPACVTCFESSPNGPFKGPSWNHRLCPWYLISHEGQRDVVRTTLYLVNLTRRRTGHGPSDFFEKKRLLADRHLVWRSETAISRWFAPYPLVWGGV